MLFCFEIVTCNLSLRCHAFQIRYMLNIYSDARYNFRLCVVWQKSKETDFLLTMNFILFTNQCYPLQNSSLGQLHSDGGVLSIVHSSAGSFCWYTFQLVGYALLDFIQSTKMAPFHVVFEPGE